MNKKPKELLVTFKKGGAFRAKLLWDKAPKTCEVIVNATPLETSEVKWGEIIGEECYFTTDIILDVTENTIHPIPGSISFNPDPKWKAVIFYYGDKIKLTKTYSKFAQIETNLEDLKKVGKRIEKEGPEGAKITTLE